MPTLVSHPDEVRVLSRRFGKGPRTSTNTSSSTATRLLAGHCQGPEKMAGWIIDTMKASGPADAAGRASPPA